MIVAKSRAGKAQRRRWRRLGPAMAALALISILSGCVVVPAYGPPGPGFYRWHYWHED